MHEQIHNGTHLCISEPRNLFPLVHGARRSLLFAGGIGITPILCMAERLAHAGADFELHYCARASERAALQAEVAAVLDWAHHGFAGVRGPLEDDGDWDYDLHASLETVAALELDYDPAARRLACQATSDGLPRYTLTLTLGGTAGFALALRERFDLGDD